MLGPSDNAGRVVVDLQEQPVHPPNRGCPRHMESKLALAAAFGALTARDLHTVGHIHDHRESHFPHDGQAAHIRHQGVVPEADAPFSEHELVAAGASDLVDHILHISRVPGTGLFSH